MPLIAVEVLDEAKFDHLPGFKRRMHWFLDNRPDLAGSIACMRPRQGEGRGQRLLAIPTRERLQRVLRYLLDESEFLSPHGIRSLSRVHERRSPTSSTCMGEDYRVDYVPGEGNTGLFGGNSNWRGPVWFPVNYLLVEALERYHHFYGDELQVECPVGSGRMLNLQEVARELERAAGRHLPGRRAGQRPCHGARAALRRRSRTGRTWCSSTSTSTATPGAASAPATRPAGPRWWSGASRTWRGAGRRRRKRPSPPGRAARREPA